MTEFALTNLKQIELASALLGIISVWLNVKSHIAGWPIGIVAVILAAWVYFHSHLFAETGLQAFYTVSGFYGWWKWSQHKATKDTISISRIPISGLVLSMISGILFTVGFGWVFKNYTSADYPWIDSGLTAFSLIAQIWLARKYLENWLLWGLINVTSVGLYAVKGLWFFLGYFAVLLVLSYVGYKKWNRNLSKPIVLKTA